MKKQHPTGQPFRVTYTNGKTQTLVALEAEIYYDKVLQTNFRKTCQGCVFCYFKVGYCSGHSYREEVCKLGGCEQAKCTPEFREDGKWIHYKQVITQKQAGS